MKLLLALGVGLCLFAPVVLAQSEDKPLKGSRIATILTPEKETISERYEVEKPLYHLIQNKDGSSVVLVYQPYGPPRSALFGISRNEKILWSNYEPTSAMAGYIIKGTGDNAGNVLVAWEDTRPRALNVRLFDAQGKVLWTTSVASLPWKDEVDAREHLWHANLLFWPQQGWLVVFSTHKRTVIQLLNEQGQAQWGEGTQLVSQQQGDSPVSLIQDSSNTIVALWYEHGYLKKPATQSLFRAQRLDVRGKPLWTSPIEVGEAPDFGWGPPREIQLALTPDQKVRAQLYKGVLNDVQRNVTEYEALIGPQGQVEK